MIRGAVATVLVAATLPALAAREFTDDAGRKKRVYLSPHLPFGWFYHQAPTEEQLTRLLSEPGVAPR